MKSTGQKARSALLWNGGFSIVRDVVQFGVTLVLVRLLNGDNYGYLFGTPSAARQSEGLRYYRDHAAARQAARHLTKQSPQRFSRGRIAQSWIDLYHDLY